MTPQTKVLTSDQKTCVLIDGANLYGSLNSLGLAMDWRKLREYFDFRCHLHRITYYTAIKQTSGKDHLRPQIDYMRHNGYTLVSKPAKGLGNDIRGNMDVEIALDLYRSSMSPFMEHIVLMSGDADFIYAVQAAQDNGCRVTAISDRTSVSDDLISAVDTYYDLSFMMPDVRKGHRDD